jgi:uncharacterized protein YecT (DUF1311 family)
MNRAPCIAALTLAVSAAAWAGGPGGSEPSADFGRCMERAQGVTAAMLDCNAAEWQRQDARLNAAYRKLMAQLPPPKRAALQDAQRLWLRYVEAKCAFLYDEQHFNGSLHRFDAAHCTVLERARRAAELEALSAAQ